MPDASGLSAFPMTAPNPDAGSESSHRVAGRWRRRQEVADGDGAERRVNLAEHLATERDRSPLAVGYCASTVLPVEHDGGAVITSAGDHAGDAPVVRGSL